MAKASAKQRTETVVTLKLSAGEACALRILAGCLDGPLESWRKEIEQIRLALGSVVKFNGGAVFPGDVTEGRLVAIDELPSYYIVYD